MVYPIGTKVLIRSLDKLGIVESVTVSSTIIYSIKIKNRILNNVLERDIKKIESKKERKYEVPVY